ncbi:MAG: hypothetical protein KME23_18040 [Goleter apudmare HA4340-LM2]|jgi:hypothetical protein|nr:hypothetical protein [Goleter apudmare HA4340-LM2]
MCCDFSAPALIGLLEATFNDPIARSRLLQQPEKLREIMNEIPARQWLFEHACHTNNSHQVKNFIVAMMKSSRLIWNGGGIAQDVYSEALSRTWEWFNKDFFTYNPQQASFVTWFNQKLRWMIQDVVREKVKEESKRLNPPADEENHEWIYGPGTEPDRWQETIQEWLDLVRNHPHRFRDCRMQSYPNVNCQVLLTQILTVLGDSGDFSWDAIAQKYGVEPSALKRFCKTRCFRIFKQLLSD